MLREINGGGWRETWQEFASASAIRRILCRDNREREEHSRQRELWGQRPLAQKEHALTDKEQEVRVAAQ